MVGVAEKRERELLRLRERQVFCLRVERRSEDRDPELLEPLGPVTQGLPFYGSTGGGGLRIPPQQHPPAHELCQIDGIAVLVGEHETRGPLSFMQHETSVSARPPERALGQLTPERRQRCPPGCRGRRHVEIEHGGDASTALRRGLVDVTEPATIRDW